LSAPPAGGNARKKKLAAGKPIAPHGRTCAIRHINLFVDLLPEIDNTCIFCHSIAMDTGDRPMDSSRIRIKIGEFELDAEGPTEIVQAQLAAFKELIGSMPREAMPAKSPFGDKDMQNRPLGAEPPHIPLEKIMHVAGRVVSLTALPASTVEAGILILLGHKDMRNHVSVTGQEIGDGLAQSGRPVPRVDRIMDKAIEDAYVLKTGLKRGTRYRLTNQGLLKALNIAATLIESLP
jgi:hypothetical protein